MNIKKRIEELTNELKTLVDRHDRFVEVLTKLKVGDTVYESGSFDDMFPQKVMEIDMENLRLLTYEKSIDVTKWVSSFYIYDVNSSKFKYIY